MVICPDNDGSSLYPGLVNNLALVKLGRVPLHGRMALAIAKFRAHHLSLSDHHSPAWTVSYIRSTQAAACARPRQHCVA